MSIKTRVNIKESDNRMVIFSDKKSNSQSQVVMVTDRGALHAFTVALALSVHSIFEGLAFGLQKSINQVSKFVHTCINSRTPIYRIDNC